MSHQTNQRCPRRHNPLYLRIIGCAVFGVAAICLGAVGLLGTASTWTATVTFPAAGATLHTHNVKPAGTVADSGGGSVPSGTTVTANITQGSQLVGSCSALTNASQGWQCSGAINLTDGSFTVTATARQVDNTDGPPSGAVNFVVSTQPTITQPSGGVTNSTKPTFGGAKTGDGTAVRLCASSTPCSAAASLCNRTGLSPSATVWTCTPVTALSSGTYYAFEIDGAGGSSAPSDPFALTVNTLPATVSGVANGATIVSRSLPLSGACASGETVTAAFTFSNGAAWPSSAAQARVSSICSSNAWSGNVLLPYNTHAANLRLVVNQVAPDATAAPTTSVSTITVEIQPFHVNSISGSESGMVIGIDGWVGDTYRLERKLVLTDSDWQAIPNANDVAPSANGPVALTDSAPPNEAETFYRVELVP